MKIKIVDIYIFFLYNKIIIILQGGLDMNIITEISKDLAGVLDLFAEKNDEMKEFGKSQSFKEAQQQNENVIASLLANLPYHDCKSWYWK